MVKQMGQVGPPASSSVFFSVTKVGDNNLPYHTLFAEFQNFLRVEKD